MLQDDEKGDIKNSLIYKMSLENSFGYFQQVILVSSPKDQYVPTYSARIQVTPQIEDDPKLGLSILEMAKNLLDSLSGTKLVRLTIVNNTITDVITTKKSLIDLNNIIGRTAHICYLENPVVAQQLMQIVFPFLVSDEDLD
ncbi:MAG: hypothetical protein M1365_01455 [Actinobacteria bacterium]|nr:hypothetical protein [Actinomycetota bacterium]